MAGAALMTALMPGATPRTTVTGALSGVCDAVVRADRGANEHPTTESPTEHDYGRDDAAGENESGF